MNSTAVAARKRARNLLFLNTPALWPAWPFLPVMRRKAGREEECGLLYDVLHTSGRTGFSATILLCNLFAIPNDEEELLALPKETFDAPEEVYAAGWRVD